MRASLRARIWTATARHRRSSASWRSIAPRATSCSRPRSRRATPTS